VSGGNKTRLVLLGIVVIIIIGLFIPVIPKQYTVYELQSRTEYYTEQEYQPDIKQMVVTLIEVYNVELKALSFKEYIINEQDTTKKSNFWLDVNVVEKNGNQIRVKFFDLSGFYAYLSSGVDNSLWRTTTSSTQTNLSYIPTQKHYFVLDNNYGGSIFEPFKYVNLRVTFMYDQDFGKYVDVQKSKIVTENVPVTHTKNVSIFQILTNTS
jgi:hypothetical protein